MDYIAGKIRTAFISPCDSQQRSLMALNAEKGVLGAFVSMANVRYCIQSYMLCWYNVFRLAH